MPAPELEKKTSLCFPGRSQGYKGKARNPGESKVNDKAETGSEKKENGTGCLILGLCIFGAGAVKLIEFVFSVSFGPIPLIILGLVVMLFATFIHPKT